MGVTIWGPGMSCCLWWTMKKKLQLQEGIQIDN